MAQALPHLLGNSLRDELWKEIVMKSENETKSSDLAGWAGYRSISVSRFTITVADSVRPFIIHR